MNKLDLAVDRCDVGKMDAMGDAKFLSIYDRVWTFTFKCSVDLCVMILSRPSQSSLLNVKSPAAVTRCRRE